MVCSGGVLSDSHLVRVEVVEDGAEGQAVPPGRAEVSHLHAPVVLCDFLTPLQQRLTAAHQGGAREGSL